MPMTVLSVAYLEGYRLRLTFNTGEAGVIDLGELAHTVPEAAPLRDVDEFRRVFLDEWPTLVWPCGFGLAPELAYEMATGRGPPWRSESPMARSA